jgi:hypothetical protein
MYYWTWWVKLHKKIYFLYQEINMQQSHLNKGHFLFVLPMLPFLFRQNHAISFQQIRTEMMAMISWSKTITFWDVGRICAIYLYNAKWKRLNSETHLRIWIYEVRELRSSILSKHNTWLLLPLTSYSYATFNPMEPLWTSRALQLTISLHWSMSINALVNEMQQAVTHRRGTNL